MDLTPGVARPSSRRRRLRGVAVAVLAAVSLVAAACGDDSSSALDDLPAVADSEYVDMTGQDTVTIVAKDNVFEPQYVTVSPGTRVVFDNRGRNPHNVIAVEQGAFEDVPTDKLQPGDTAELVFSDSGDFPYYCSLHATPTRGMTGRIRVAEDG